MFAKRELGKKFECLAAEHLRNEGFEIIYKNFYSRFGEIDLIVIKKNLLVFVEVRQRKNALYGSALETVSISKQKKLTRTAEYFLLKNPKLNDHEMRFDVIGVTSSRIEWIQGAFYAQR